jgi:two-component system phosphate regulon response regulator PhoB
MSKKSILVIEDEPAIIDVLTYNLEKEGFDVSSTTNGRDGLQLVKSKVPDLVILDLMLPGTDGLEICRDIRSDPRTRHVRVLMLTAKSEELDEIVGFNMGADDYVTKPFKIKALIHRIKAALRRHDAPANAAEVVVIDDLEINRRDHHAKLRGQELPLTATEFRLLWTLARQPGRTFSRSELMDSSRGEDANALERTIDVHIRSLRRKLEDEADLIETVRGVGYRFKT